LFLIAFGYWWMRPTPPLKVVSYSAITGDGEVKSGPLLTDGSRIYFAEERPTGLALVEVSTVGGDTAVINTGFQFGGLSDISSDHSSLLAFESAPGGAYEAPLWIVPVPAGAPRQIGGIMAIHAA